MIQRYIGYLIGRLFIFFYKFIYPKRLYYGSHIKFNNRSNILIEKKCKLVVGNRFNVRKNVSFYACEHGKIKFGDNCFINDNCVICCRNKITVGNNFHMGNNSSIYDHDHDYNISLDDYVSNEVVIGNNVWIGSNVVILKGVHIGDNCVIAAGTVVKEDVPKNSMLYQDRKNIIKNIKK